MHINFLSKPLGGTDWKGDTGTYLKRKDEGVGGEDLPGACIEQK
jgi:hypothetical protein